MMDATIYIRYLVRNALLHRTLTRPVVVVGFCAFSVFWRNPALIRTHVASKQGWHVKTNEPHLLRRSVLINSTSALRDVKPFL